MHRLLICTTRWNEYHSVTVLVSNDAVCFLFFKVRDFKSYFILKCFILIFAGLWAVTFKTDEDRWLRYTAQSYLVYMYLFCETFQDEGHMFRRVFTFVHFSLFSKLINIRIKYKIRLITYNLKLTFNTFYQQCWFTSPLNGNIITDSIFIDSLINNRSMTEWQKQNDLSLTPVELYVMYALRRDPDPD